MFEERAFEFESAVQKGKSGTFMQRGGQFIASGLSVGEGKVFA